MKDVEMFPKDSKFLNLHHHEHICYVWRTGF